MSLGPRSIAAADRFADIDPVFRREEEVRKMQSQPPNQPADLMGSSRSGVRHRWMLLLVVEAWTRLTLPSWSCSRVEWRIRPPLIVIDTAVVVVIQIW